MTDAVALAEEEARIRRLQRTVDLALFYIRAAPINRNTAEMITDKVRARAIEMFPGKEETFDLIYLPRFRRAMEEKFGLH